MKMIEKNNDKLQQFLTGFFAVFTIVALVYIAISGYNFGVWLKGF